MLSILSLIFRKVLECSLIELYKCDQVWLALCNKLNKYKLAPIIKKQHTTRTMTKFKSITLAFFCLLFLISATFLGIELQTKSLLNNKVELKVPKDFEIMSDEMMKLKYPSERRPTLVFTNKSGGINVALNLTKNKANQDLMVQYKENFVKTFKSMYPSAEWIESGIKEVNGKKVGFLELITPAIDTKIYNLMFFTDVEGQLLLCTFNCTEKSVKEWEPTAKEIMTSLKIK